MPCSKREIIYYIGVGLSALLVSTIRAMRRPLHCGASDKNWLHVFYVYNARLLVKTSVKAANGGIYERYMQTVVFLPKWLDGFIFNNLKAQYKPTNGDMAVIDWDKKNVLRYLGTYFPRSYAESYCIFSNYFSKHKSEWENKVSISIFDFGCGTGGEIMGLAMAVKKQLPSVHCIKGKALDGNHHALRLFDCIKEEVSRQLDISIQVKPAPTTIYDFYDLSVIEDVINSTFDIIMSFKAICEFVTKERFEQNNAYKYISSVLLPKLENDGVMLLVDVSTYSNTSKEWLPTMMDKGLSGYKVIGRNTGFNQTFFVSHSRIAMDRSKVAWRMMTT